MKYKMLSLLGCLFVAAAVSGCYSKVSGGSRMGLPFANFSKDEVYGLYEKPLEAVYNSAVAVLNKNGVIEKESLERNDGTNMVKTIVARVDQRNVYVRVQPQDVNQTLIRVQARTPAGIADLPLAHNLEKQVALGLAH